MKTAFAALATLLLTAGGAQAQRLTGNACQTTSSGRLECAVTIGALGGLYIPTLTLGAAPNQLAEWRISGRLDVGPCGGPMRNLALVPATALTTSTPLGFQTVLIEVGRCFQATLTCSDGTQTVSCSRLAALGANVTLTRR